MAANRPRPLSPHLTIWRWGPAMLVSILHRITGSGLSILGLGVLTWWLLALSGGPESYSAFVNGVDWLTGSAITDAQGIGWKILAIVGLIVGIGLTWAFFQHLLSGIRHLVMDTGTAFELGVNKTSAILTILGSVLLTAALWFYLLGGVK